MNNDIRWKQRFENFEKSYATYQRMMAFYMANPEEEAAQLAATQAFEICVELAWKVMKDYLENEGFEINSPKETIRQAFASDIIQGKNGEVWMQALNLRNLASHTYDKKNLDVLLTFILEEFPDALAQLNLFLKGKL